MSGLKPTFPSQAEPRNPRCLKVQEVPAVCLRLQSRRQQIALPYALLLRSQLAEDESTCLIAFATHEVSVRGHHLRDIYLAVSQGQAAQISIGESHSFPEGSAFIGPLVTDIRIEPIDESGRSRR